MEHIKKLEPGLWLNTKTGNMKYCSVCAACENYLLKSQYKEYYATTVGLSGIQFGADL